jgi:tetratricopeptide (TPR) repeat protein
VDPRTALVTAKVVARIPGILRRGDRAVALARETGAAVSVGGSYYKDGDSLRAAVRVVGTESGQVLRLVTPVAGVASDPGTLVTALARLTVAAVAATLDTTSAGLAATLSPPPSYEAYAETSRAWESYYRGDSADAFRRARRAIALDSGYAPPLLMQAYMLGWYDRYEEADSTLKRVHALRLRLTPVETAVFHVLEADVAGDLGARLIAAREMMRLAPASSEAATLVAGSALRLGYNAEVLSALGRVDPERGLLLFLPSYWTMSAQALHNLGRFQEAAAAARRGMRQAPADWGLWLALVASLAAAGDYGAALRAAHERVPGDPFPAYNAAWFASVVAVEFRGHDHERLAVRLLDSLADHPFPHSVDSGQARYDRVLKGEIFYQAGRWRAADSVLRPLVGQFRDELWLTGRLATLDARLGRRADAERVSAELRDRPAGYLHGRQTFWRAHIAAALGQREAAVLLLRDAYAQGYPMNDDYDVLPHADRDFAELLHDPAFLGVMRRE